MAVFLLSLTLLMCRRLRKKWGAKSGHRLAPFKKGLVDQTPQSFILHLARLRFGLFQIRKGFNVAPGLS